MTRTAFGGNRGNFGIFRARGPDKLTLSMTDSRPRGTDDPASYPSAYRLPSLWRHRSDRPDRTVRGSVAYPESLMEDTKALGWIRKQAQGACRIFSVRTGALICGAAGLLKG